MPPRKKLTADTGHFTPWGTLDWSHAPVARIGYMGPCYHCGRPAIMRHPVSGAPCHKACEDRAPRHTPQATLN